MFHPYTCPRIDKNIEYFKKHLNDWFSEQVKELSPKFASTDEFYVYIREQADEFYDDIECLFEDLRNSNSDLRDAAEKELDNRQSEIDDLQQQIAHLEETLNNKNNEIDRLNDIIGETCE